MEAAISELFTYLFYCELFSLMELVVYLRFLLTLSFPSKKSCYKVYACRFQFLAVLLVHMVSCLWMTDGFSFFRCFLSDETLSISNNIEEILQCALDFRSCLANGLGDFKSDNQSLIDHMSQINIPQVRLKEWPCLFQLIF